MDGAGLVRRCTQMMSAPLGEVATMHGDAEDGVYVYEDETPERIKPFCWDVPISLRQVDY